MSKIKLCGLTRPCDIAAANALQPEYIGFVFACGSRRQVTPAQAAQLRALLTPGIQAVGVFVDQPPAQVAALVNEGVIGLAQLHGHEDESYIRQLRSLAPCPVIQAVRVRTAADIARAQASTADYLLLDAGAGAGAAFDWQLAAGVQRPYFLAGGLTPHNVAAAIQALHPFAVDVSSGIESGGVKDKTKMAAFVAAVRKGERA